MSSPPIEDVACNEEVVATTTNNSSPPDNGAQGKSPEIPTNLTNSKDNCAPDPENRGHSAEKKRKFISSKELFWPPVDKIAKKTDEQPVRKKRKCGKTMIMQSIRPLERKSCKRSQRELPKSPQLVERKLKGSCLKEQRKMAYLQSQNPKGSLSSTQKASLFWKELRLKATLF